MTEDPVIDLAAAHGLELDPASIRHNEAGLDFRVSYARSADGTDWILRVPRRAEVGAALGKEAAILRLAGERLSVAVPDWQIVSEELVAYPALPGTPGLTLDGDQPVWHLDPGSHTYAESVGRFLAELHAIPVDEVRARGIEVREPADVRREWQRDVDAVVDSFRVAPELREQLDAWLADDALWPERTVFGHGEPYAAHTLVDDDGALTGVIDWTTARVDDPARDFAFQYLSAPADAFEATVAAYRAAGGAPWPRLTERCAAIVAASPVGYGIYALTTGRAEHREVAQGLLDP